MKSREGPPATLCECHSCQRVAVPCRERQRRGVAGGHGAALKDGDSDEARGAKKKKGPNLDHPSGHAVIIKEWVQGYASVAEPERHALRGRHDY